MKKEYKLQDGRTAVFEYDANGIGKITVEAMDCLIDMLPKWIPCSERLPEDGTYLCWEWQGFCYVDSFKNGNWETAEKCYTKCLAWMHLPEPYKEGENG